MKPTITKITDEWIKEKAPCQEALDWWGKKELDTIKILKWLIKAKKYSWANWFIVRVMEYKDYVSYAVFAAEQVIKIYEKKYPHDKRPRQAIEAAKKCIKDPSAVNKKNATYAAADAADAAAYAAYAYAAANAAADAANAAAYAYANAAADAADAAAYAAAKVRLKILIYGMKLLTKKD
jgi:hypothetical protein